MPRYLGIQRIDIPLSPGIEQDYTNDRTILDPCKVFVRIDGELVPLASLLQPETVKPPL